MKKTLLALIGCAMFSGVSAQTILDEGFDGISTTETFTTTFPTGWSTIDTYKGDDLKYKWNIYYTEKGTINGNVASCDGAMFSSSPDAAKGPREEILLTPELDLNNTYQLSFDWEGASAAALEQKGYDLQVRIAVDGDVDNAVTVWSFQDAGMLKESGVMVFPWIGWTVYNSKIDLSPYQGKKVKIAFVYKMTSEHSANVAYIDNVKVSQFTPETAPKPVLSRTSYDFGDVYIGSKVYSEVITLKNEGVNGLTISDIQLPAGVETTLNKEAVKLDKNESVDFQLIYDAELLSAADGNVVIKTNGGDATVRVVANKVALPENATFENFEKGVPPAGWTSNGWLQIGYALEGDYSAYSSGSLDGAQYLVSPRLDLSQGAQSVSFTYFNEFDSEYDGSYPQNDILLELSTDGGASWKTVWKAATEDLNIIKKETIELGTPASDNCYLRWVYSSFEYDSEYGVEISRVFLDCVVLPKIYGLGGVPQASELVSPVDNAENIYNKNVKLEWKPALFATGYKIYVGTDAAATNLVNGEDLGDVTSYVVPACAYATTYKWKVVPYNAQGDAAGVSTWSFTTIADQTVSAFPWEENFENEPFPSLGWHIEKEGYTTWDYSSTKPFEGKRSAIASCRVDEGATTLITPDFELPEGNPMLMSFYWGNSMPVSLAVDNTGLTKNPTTGDNGIEACSFEIFADGAWKQLAFLSDNTPEDERYWYRERIDLTEYAGKTVSFRWHYVGHNYMKSHGVALDRVVLAPLAAQNASFNVAEWNAGKVNYKQEVSSGDIISLMNDGNEVLTVKSVEFANPNFTSTLAAGTVIPVGQGLAFGITFNALETAAAVDDEMKVTFEGGYALSLPVEGEALPADTRYYSFDQDVYGSLQPKGFTTIDVDRKATIQLAMLDYENYGAPMAFMVMNVIKADWRNVYPTSGDQCLVVFGASDYTSVEDWLISDGMVATADSRFTFRARNYESQASADIGNPWAQSKVSVLVSTTSKTDRATFETVKSEAALPYYNGEYETIDVDLSKYAGQRIFVAVCHTVTDGLAAMFDDFIFEHFSAFDHDGSDVKAINNDLAVSVYPNPVTSVLRIAGAEKANVTVTNVAGATVLKETGVGEVNVSGLASGIYVVAVETENGIYTTRVIKK